MNSKILGTYGLSTEKVLDIVPTLDSDVVFLSGSIIEGFGNKGSDLDVYIISRENQNNIPRDVPFKEFPFGTEYTFLGHEILISVMLITENNLIKLLSKVNTMLERKQVGSLDKKSIELYHRVYNGVAIKGMQNYQEYLGLLNIHIFSQSLHDNRTSYSENRQDDAIGALESGDIYTAFISARISLETAVEALLYLKGETNPSDKWLFRKLFKHFTPDEEWVKDFLNLYVGISDIPLQEKTKEMLRLANSIRLMSFEVSI